jgi:hypothetical protein
MGYDPFVFGWIWVKCLAGTVVFCAIIAAVVVVVEEVVGKVKSHNGSKK